MKPLSRSQIFKLSRGNVARTLLRQKRVAPRKTFKRSMRRSPWNAQETISINWLKFLQLNPFATWKPSSRFSKRMIKHCECCELCSVHNRSVFKTLIKRMKFCLKMSIFLYYVEYFYCTYTCTSSTTVVLEKHTKLTYSIFPFLH